MVPTQEFRLEAGKYCYQIGSLHVRLEWTTVIQRGHLIGRAVACAPSVWISFVFGLGAAIHHRTRSPNRLPRIGWM